MFALWRRKRRTLFLFTGYTLHGYKSPSQTRRVIPALRRWRQENLMFKASTGNQA
jgi:hypothetical protein